MALRLAPQRARISRKARASFLARRSLKQFLVGLKMRQPRDWPPHLFGAWQVLTAGMGVSDAKARSIVCQSVSVAHDCVKAQSKRTERFEAEQAPLRISKTCHRVANCLKRASATLRRRLDAELAVLMQNLESDLETVDAIFATTKAGFEDQQFRSSKFARTALEALEAPRAADYATLDIRVRQKVMTALAELASSGRQVTAVGVFEIVANLLGKEKTSRLSLQSRDLRTRYIADLRKIWLKAGLKPKRLLSYIDGSPISKFHCFAELVYVGMAAPSTFHDNKTASPVDAQSRLALEQSDYRWEISDDHVRNGLLLPFKFSHA